MRQSENAVLQLRWSLIRFLLSDFLVWDAR